MLASTITYELVEFLDHNGHIDVGIELQKGSLRNVHDLQPLRKNFGYQLQMSVDFNYKKKMVKSESGQKERTSSSLEDFKHIFSPPHYYHEDRPELMPDLWLSVMHLTAS